MRAMGKGSISSFITVLLNMALCIFALGLFLVVVLLIFSPFIRDPMEVDASWLVVGTNMTIPVSFNVDTPITAPSLGVQNAQIQKARGSLRFPVQEGGAFFVANAILLLIMFGLALFVVIQLRSVFRTLREGRPFVPANATRLRWIAGGVIAGELVRAAVVFYENYYAMTHFSAQGLRFDIRPDLNVFGIVLGLIILVISEVFRAGTQLDEDRAMTI
jgi:Protein of unknown function (DUF2975)